MANPLVIIVPINLSINKPVYGRFLGNRFWNANDRQRLFCVFSALCKALHKYEIYIYQMKVLIKSNRMMHVRDQSNKRDKIYGGLKNFFVDHSPNMVLLWSHDQS